MTELSETLRIAASGMQAQSGRLRLVTENVANADTPGYRRKLVSFEQVVEAGLRTALIRPGKVALDQSPLEKVFDPAHPLADESGHFDGSNVDIVVEIADAREAQRSYEANLKMFDQARQMTKGLLEILRR